MSSLTSKKQRLLGILARSPIIEIACKQAGIGRSTYYRWHKEDSEFAEAADRAIAVSVELVNDMAEAQLIAAIKERSLVAIFYWLNHRHPAYKTRVQLDAHIYHEPPELSADQALLVEQALKHAGLLLGDSHENR